MARLELKLKALCSEGRLKEAIHILLTTHNPHVEPRTYIQLLQTCIVKNALSEGKQIHLHINHNTTDFKLSTHTSLQCKLISMYDKCGSLEDARTVFDDMSEPNLSSWNTIVGAYRRHGLPREALKLFYQMQRTSVKPDSFTFSSILPACASTEALEPGMEIHRTIMESTFLSDAVVVNAVIDMYAKCGSMKKARQLFDKMPQRNVVSWNAIVFGYAHNGVIDEAWRLFQEMPQRNVISWNAVVAGYAHNGLLEKALEVINQMQLDGIKPNSATFAGILPACTQMGALEQGVEIHRRIRENGFLSDVVLGNTLIAMYAKCGSIQKARELFDQLPQQDVVSWNAIIAGYAQHGLVENALEIFSQMQGTDIQSDQFTFSSILSACTKTGSLEWGMEIHQRIIGSGLFSEVVAVNALIDMYAKCGRIKKARRLFDKMHDRNVVSWTTMIAGYALHGYGWDALKLFELMKHSGTNPNHVSFVCVLYACSHAGLVEEGCKYFCHITPKMDHYACMVDLLGRAGHLEEALNFIIKMPIIPDEVVWMCLFAACRSRKNIWLGEFVATLVFELDPKCASPYILLSNIYADVGRWDGVQKVRKMMKDKGIKKVPGFSWIEVHKMVHTFCVGDRSHPQTQGIYAMLENLSWEVKAAGYIPNTRLALNNVEELEKKLFLHPHSEMLAIAFGLLNTPPGTTIRVVKNLRVCGDCHTATKIMSKIVAREIVVRDANRFHHFEQGECSCGDYWKSQQRWTEKLKEAAKERRGKFEGNGKLHSKRYMHMSLCQALKLSICGINCESFSQRKKLRLENTTIVLSGLMRGRKNNLAKAFHKSSLKEAILLQNRSKI
ncbi:hypothetical protein KI387_019751, partial [Taxus chinensis]